MTFREFHGTRRSQRARFLRVHNLKVPFVTIAEFFFDLVGEMSGTHHHAADTLRSQLPDQQLKKRRTSKGSQRFGRSWQYRFQSRTYFAYEEHGSDVFSSSNTPGRN